MTAKGMSVFLNILVRRFETMFCFPGRRLALDSDKDHYDQSAQGDLRWWVLELVNDQPSSPLRKRSTNLRSNCYRGTVQSRKHTLAGVASCQVQVKICQ